MKRIAEFDGLRFFLCLGIAIFHFSFRVPVKNDHLQELILTFSYFTDVFFIVSGLFLARRNNYIWSRRHYIGFVGKRLARIYPLHAITFTCFALLSVLTAAGVLHPTAEPNMSLSDGVTQLLLIHDWGLGRTLSYNYVSWSLSALFLMYLCFPLFDILCHRLGGAILVVIIIAALGGEYLAQKLNVSSITRIQFADIGILRALPSFLFGMWLARQTHHKVPAIFIKVALAACLVIFLFYHPATGAGEPATLEGPLRLAFLYFCLYVLYLAAIQNIYTPLRFRPLVTLSRYSFGIFILHPLIGLVFFNALPQHWGETTMGALLVIGGGVLVSLFAAIVAWHFFENPINRWLVTRINAWVNREDEAAKLPLPEGSA
ncbi:acyltransferase family protein [Brucella rhizosphaerae]|uniref:Acyltransferase family protein n=1 Tax=Brucella rhizosphaerae TaxID=571254 RepID=A0A256F4L3_9HYPH|nr:acyltransferase [Brucella rhizosphaerae]OYR09646.1 acyltransferase family protein [Brucella rhizosphaerae]